MKLAVLLVTLPPVRHLALAGTVELRFTATTHKLIFDRDLLDTVKTDSSFRDCFWLVLPFRQGNYREFS